MPLCASIFLCWTGICSLLAPGMAVRTATAKGLWAFGGLPCAKRLRARGKDPSYRGGPRDENPGVAEREAWLQAAGLGSPEEGRRPSPQNPKGQFHWTILICSQLGFLPGVFSHRLLGRPWCWSTTVESAHRTSPSSPTGTVATPDCQQHALTAGAVTLPQQHGAIG